jgi:hypothetical protein
MIMLIAHQNDIIHPQKRIVIIIGNYGSGKSEVAVNLALFFEKHEDLSLTIADLDVINPYFRSREAIDLLTENNIRVVAPTEDRFYADLPIILPEIKGMFENREGLNIFDVGGDDVGCRVLKSFENSISDYELLQVINSNRPYTDTIEKALNSISKLEDASGLKVSGLIGNDHLMEHTTLETINEGIEFLKILSEKSGIPIKFVTAMDHLFEKVVEANPVIPIFSLKRLLGPPWSPKDSRG